MKLERRNEGHAVRDAREEELQGRDQVRDDDRYDTRHSRTLRMQAADRETEDPLRGKSDGEILMRYEF